MSDITALLRRAARGGVTIYWDDKREAAVMWPIKGVDRNLIKDLNDHADEIMDLLRGAQFWGCCCRECRGTVH